MVGVLLDLAEGGEPLAIRMTSGRLLRGAVELVALDAVALRTAAGLLTLLRLDAIVSVRRVPGLQPAVPPPSRPAPGRQLGRRPLSPWPPDSPLNARTSRSPSPARTGCSLASSGPSASTS